MQSVKQSNNSLQENCSKASSQLTLSKCFYLMERHAYWGILVVFVAAHWTQLSLVGVINRQPLSPLNALTGVCAAWSFWLVVKPFITRLFVQFAPSRSNLIKVFVPLAMVLALCSIVWSAFTDYYLMPGTPQVSRMIPYLLAYDSGLGIVLAGVFMFATFWSRKVRSALIRSSSIPSPSKEQSNQFNLVVKKGQKTIPVRIADIHLITAQDYYAEITTDTESFLIRQPIYRLAENLSHHGFVRINRSTIINQSWISALVHTPAKNASLEAKDGQLYTVSKTYLGNLKQFVNKLAQSPLN